MRRKSTCPERIANECAQIAEMHEWHHHGWHWSIIIKTNAVDAEDLEEEATGMICTWFDYCKYIKTMNRHSDGISAS